MSQMQDSIKRYPLAYPLTPSPLDRRTPLHNHIKLVSLGAAAGWWLRYSRDKSAGMRAGHIHHVKTARSGVYAAEARSDLESWNDASRLPPHRDVSGAIVGGYTERNVRREARAERAAVGKAEGIRGHYFARAKVEH